MDVQSRNEIRNGHRMLRSEAISNLMRSIRNINVSAAYFLEEVGKVGKAMLLIGSVMANADLLPL